MTAQEVFSIFLSYWPAYVTLMVGTMVSSLVFVTLRRYGARRRLARFSTEDDLPWEQLLELLQARERELAGSASAPDKELPPDKLLNLLLSLLPDGSSRAREIPAEEQQFVQSGGAEKRSSRRRWGNPTPVHVASVLLPSPLHGIVINRSAGGLGIFVDQGFQTGSLLQVRPAEAPGYVPSIEIEVKFCRKVRRQFFIGCQFQSEIPWNVRVWFG